MRLLRPIALLAALLLLAPSASAGPWDELADSPLVAVPADEGVFQLLLNEPVAAPFPEQRYEALLARAVGLAPSGTRVVRLVARDYDGSLVPLETFLPLPGPVPQKAGEPSGVAPVDLPGDTPGFLSGKAVYVSQCHGWIYYDSLDGFSTQRGNVWDTVEDFHNPEGANQYLVRYLENAGAAVFTVKERDMTDEQAIADNDGGGYVESGSGWETGPLGFADTSPWVTAEDPFDAGTTRRVNAASGGVATWTPGVPGDGWWAVYVSWDSDSTNAPDAHYRITHPGGEIHRWYDQTIHGSTWQYTETLWLPGSAGGLTVELVADSAYSDRYVSADAVRVGGGMGDVIRMGDMSGRPRWEEGANLHTQYNGAPTAVYDPGVSGIGSDVAARSRWAAWEHPSGEDAVYFSWHSNAGGGTGTVTLTYDGSSGGPTAGSEDFAELVQEETVDAIRALWDSGWSDRGVYGGAFGELNPSHNPEMPAALMELAFHDHEWDTALLKEPTFRRDASRAFYRGIVRYFAERDGITPTYLPEPPTHLAILHDGAGALEASWQAGPTGFPYGDAPTSYRVFTSADGLSWDNGVDVSGTSRVLDAAPDELVFVRVSALNAGGGSFPTEVLGARRSWDGTAPLLLVDAYDRLQASQLMWESIGGALGDVRRMILPRMNNFDTTRRHALSIDALGWPFESVTDELVPGLDLTGWDGLIWAAGEESTADESFSDDQQAAIRAFVEGGGVLWSSGSEVLWDLDHLGSTGDQAFAEEVLGVLMAADDAGTTAVDGVGLLAGLELDFGIDDGALYDNEYPDALDSDRTVIAEYSGGLAAAVVGEGVAHFGIPFEAIGDETARDEVTARLLAELLPDYEPPAQGDDDDAGPDDDDVQPDDDDVGPDDDDSAVVDDDDEPVTPPLYPGTRQSLIPEKGCGCSSVMTPGAGGAGLGLLLLLLAGWRRRRRGRRLLVLTFASDSSWGRRLPVLTSLVWALGIHRIRYLALLTPDLLTHHSVQSAGGRPSSGPGRGSEN